MRSCLRLEAMIKLGIGHEAEVSQQSSIARMLPMKEDRRPPGGQLVSGGGEDCQAGGHEDQPVDCDETTITGAAVVVTVVC